MRVNQDGDQITDHALELVLERQLCRDEDWRAFGMAFSVTA